MKVLTVGVEWIGGISQGFKSGLEECGAQVEMILAPDSVKWMKQRLLPPKLLGVRRIEKSLTTRIWQEFNQKVRDRAAQYLPDIFFVVNEMFLLPETLRFLRDKLETITICWIADDPFDSSRYEVLPINLRYFTHIFVAEPTWLAHIKMVSNPKVLEVLHGAVNPAIFHPVQVSEQERGIFEGPLSFVGSSYGGKLGVKVEGFYRGEILRAVSKCGLKLWGDEGWSHYFQYFPELKSCWQMRATSLRETNVVNQTSDIVLNISNPQLFTAPQLRTFEIPASGGFQLADRRSEIDALFPNGDIIQFSSPKDLREKVCYYLAHPDERRELAKRAGDVVCKKHTFRHRAEAILRCIH